MQNKLKLRDFLPFLSQLIHDLLKSRKKQPIDKRRRNKEKVMKNKNDAKKKQKIEADKTKFGVEDEVKVEAEAKAIEEK
jgi:hypothetical protein